MRKILMKFSDERNRKYCIRTIIAEDEKTGQRFVYKSNIYEEGKMHIRQIMNNVEMLENAYSSVKICPVQLMQNGELKFDYIKGTSLEELYRQAMLKNDISKMENLLKLHADILMGNHENACEFSITAKFHEIFGLDVWEGNKKALKISNFDGNAGNIIFQNDTPVFVDYEWVFDFPIPADMVIFYNIQDVYKHINGMEEFYPLHQAKEYLGININDEVMDRVISSFFSYVYQEKDGTSYALGKFINAKGQKNYRDYDFIEKSWRDASQANSILNQRVQSLEKEKAQLMSELEQEKENHRIHAKQIEDAVQEQAHQSETWRVAYETVINTKSWRMIQKIKRMFGRR